jgi:hypothetical protein
MILRNLIGATTLALALSIGGFALAAEGVPETPAEHQEAASELRTKAKGHRAEAEMHHKMAEMYGTRIKGPHSKKPNPWLVNMVKHCKAMADKANALAVEEEKAAAVHEKQAKAGAETAAK